jgi:response regulator RpfG family c-di-GMP phosphodiesterase
MRERTRRPERVDAPLVVDSDDKFLNSLRKESADNSVRPVVARNMDDALERIGDPDWSFSAIFLNPMISSGRGINLVKAALIHQLGAPIYFIYNEDQKIPFTEDEIKSLSVRNSFQKPISYKEMIELIQPIVDEEVLDFLKNSSVQDSENQPTGVEFSDRDVEFSPTLAQNFLSGKDSLFDVYIRLRSGRYLKLLHAGDSFSAGRLQSYIRKGVKYFYLRKRAQVDYLKFCDVLTNKLIKNSSISNHVKTSQVLNLGEETMNFMKQSSVDEESQKFALNFVGKMHELIKSHNLMQYPEIKTLMNDVMLYEHGVATVLVASLLVKPFGINSERFYRMVGMSAFFHDIGLTKLDPFLRDENEDQMNTEQRAIYLRHPLIGAKILGRIRFIEMPVVQAVEQHHERRNANGFPNRISAGSISRMAEIVAMADEFVQAISKTTANPSMDAFEQMETKFDGFSYPVIEAFKIAFMRKKD